MTPADRPATEPRTEAGRCPYCKRRIAVPKPEAAQGAAPRGNAERAEGLDAIRELHAGNRYGNDLCDELHPGISHDQWRDQPRDKERRLRLAAERVIASFDWQDGPLPIITDSPLAFGNAVNRLRDALRAAPRAEGLDSDELLAALSDILRWTKPGSLFMDGTHGYSPAGPEKVARLHNRARAAFGDAPLPPAPAAPRAAAQYWVGASGVANGGNEGAAPRAEGPQEDSWNDDSLESGATATASSAASVPSATRSGDDSTVCPRCRHASHASRCSKAMKNAGEEFECGCLAAPRAEGLPPVNMLAEAIHSTYSAGCSSHALEECPYPRSKRTPVDFMARAERIHDWLSANWGAAPLDLDQLDRALTASGFPSSEGAAPRAEGLDVERLAEALRTDPGIDAIFEDVDAAAADIAYRYADTFRRRPSDERVPESEER